MELLNSAIWTYVCRHRLISDKPFGFRDIHCTGDDLIYSMQQLRKVIDEKQDIRLICLDISRAFDNGQTS